MDSREFTGRFAEVTKDMSLEESAAVLKLFQGISNELNRGQDILPAKTLTNQTIGVKATNEITPRIEQLKNAYENVLGVMVKTAYKNRSTSKHWKEGYRKSVKNCF